jgi:hypothetical protein
MFVMLYNWELEIVEKPKLEIEAQANRYTWGRIDYEKKIITIRQDLPLDLKR